MKTECFKIGKIPAVIYGEDSDKAYIFVHGKCGNKEEGRRFAEVAQNYGYRVLAFDLPEHGERKLETDGFNPWCVVPELKEILQFAASNFGELSLRANSIGAWFAMQSFTNYRFKNCLFVSPMIDMCGLISGMMAAAGVTAEELKQKGTIATDFGETLSFRYFEFVNNRKIESWESKTEILFAETDNLTSRSIVQNFAARFNCKLSIMPNGEHWFHTNEQLEFLKKWETENI